MVRYPIDAHVAIEIVLPVAIVILLLADLRHIHFIRNMTCVLMQV